MIDIRSHHVFIAFFIAVLCHALAIYGIGHIRTPQEPVTLARVIEGMLIAAPEPLPVQPAKPAVIEPEAVPEKPPVDKPQEQAVAKTLPEPALTEIPAMDSDTPLPEALNNGSTSTESTTSPVTTPEPEPVFTPPRVDARNRDNPPPVYPRMARRLGQAGTVILEVFILADGSVGDAKLKTSSGYSRLDDAALEAVKHWRYVPARLGDKAVSHWYTQSVKFVLNQ